MRGALILTGLLGALACALPAQAAVHAANGAILDPQNLIADDIEAEALASYRRQAAQQPFRGHEIVIVDYRLPSSAKRLYILDLITGAVEAHYVAHGRGSDPDHTHLAVRFSNVAMTGMSSVGAYRGLDRYESPAHGPALKLAGLDRTNADAYDRLIVFHTAAYFDPEHGLLGRSCGCFVVTRADMQRVYDVIAGGGFLYAGPARLNDASANLARDCNPACGNICATGPLIADARRSAPTRVAALTAPPAPMPVALPPPVPLAPAPNPIAPVLPIAVALLVPTPRAKPALPSDAPVRLAEVPLPHPKPALESEPIVVAFEAPVPAPKPAGAVVPAASAQEDDPPTPVPVAKPDSLTASAQIAADESQIPTPLPKPALVQSAQATASAAASIPIPVPKPAVLRPVADAG